jgi:23S rRNA (guanosine2251-2'-O)-methyltransferase
MNELIYGKNAVLAYLKNEGVVKKAFLMRRGTYDEIEVYLKKQSVRIEWVDKHVLDKKVKGVHQGVVLEIEGYKTVSLDSLIRNAKHNLIVLCDQIEDPHNLGAILRTCDATGVDGVIIGKHRSVSLNATVAKVSTGAIHSVPVAQVTNMSQAISTLKEAGYFIVTAENGINASDYTDFRVDMPLVLVVGSEGKGVSRIVKEASDILVTIPMMGSVNSLNVSVATGVMLYEIVRRRR